eukprot:428474-Alexandrium_andersonii.AAC.1
MLRARASFAVPSSTTDWMARLPGLLRRAGALTGALSRAASIWRPTDWQQTDARAATATRSQLSRQPTVHRNRSRRGGGFGAAPVPALRS